jgi:nucleoside-diphosphate-sugar epimerase
MRVAFIGGTRLLGPPAIRLLADAGHDVAVCHTGAHEHPGLAHFEHLHGARDDLLAARGPVQRWRPEVLVDTFAGGATRHKAKQLHALGDAAAVRHMIVVSSLDVYQYCVDAGFYDGSGFKALPAGPLPIAETAPLREGPCPGGSDAHDNVAMESALHDSGNVTALRPGAIYGPHPDVREWTLVRRVIAGDRRLPLPDGGHQVLHRVAVERVGRAIVAAIEHAPTHFWACNVIDPYDWTYAGLAAEIGRLLDWQWEPEHVAFSETEHPWQAGHPILASDRRLQENLGVSDDQPDPLAALAETVNWLWENPPAQSRFH